jgi:type 1 fimbriae regulatory protein FimB/type 1 fimbriae regulatory protein FimE
MDTAGNSRNPTRDRLLVLLAFRLALRVSELVDIRRQQIDLDTATIHIRRAKNGTPGIHGLQGDELRLLRALRREHPHADFVFLSERKAPVQKLIERLGVAAELPFTLPGTPWPAAGSIRVCFRPFMGHRSIANTVVHTDKHEAVPQCGSLCVTRMIGPACTSIGMTYRAAGSTPKTLDREIALEKAKAVAMAAEGSR